MTLSPAQTAQSLESSLSHKANMPLVSIIFLVELQEVISLWYAVLGISAFSLRIILGIRIYKKLRA